MPETIHDRLKRLRQEANEGKGWTMQEVAEKLDIAWQTVQGWETKTAPGRDKQPQVAKLYGVSVQYLMTGSDRAEAVDSVRVATLKPIVDQMREQLDRLEQLVTQPFKPQESVPVRTQLTGPGVLPKSDSESAHKLTRRRR